MQAIKEKQPEPIDEKILASIVKNSGDVGQLSEEQRFDYYKKICELVGLNPLSMPFRYIQGRDGKWILYCDRSGAQQLNKLHNVSCEVRSRVIENGVCIVTVRATLPSGRYMDGIGAVPVEGLTGEAYSNKLMFCSTKACRRATLDLLGLGILDETETESMKDAKKLEPAIPETPAHKMNPYKRKYETCAEVSNQLRQATEVKELASLWYVNAELIESDAETKKEFTDRKNELYIAGIPKAPQLPVNDTDELQKTIDWAVKDIYLQRSVKTLDLYYDGLTKSLQKNPQCSKAYLSQKEKLSINNEK